VAPETRTYTSTGGTVVVACAGGTAYLLSWSPADGYRTKKVDPGPSERATVTFKQRGTEVDVTASCPGEHPVVEAA
jgi:hypothetical protein